MINCVDLSVKPLSILIKLIFVNDTFKVSQSDYNDAQSILNWNKDSNNLVAGNLSNERMNEYKTHINWASKVLFLADVYGIK